MKKNVFIIFLFFGLTAVAQQLDVNSLQCQAKTNPIGIDTYNPKLSWQLEGAQRGIMQTAYRIWVADTKELLEKGMGNTWDSKKIVSGQSNQVTFAGNKLQPATTYYWKVQVWDNKNQTATSRTTSFTTGLFTTADWSNAQWIGYEAMPDSLLTVPGVHSPDVKRKLGATKLKERITVPLFRKSFTINKTISNAAIFISGLGQYELNINGKKTGNSFLAPGWTHYDRRVLYNTYDVTAALQTGSNAIGVIVGNGFFNVSRERYIKLAIAYGYPKMICKLLVRYTDGSATTLVSDATWKTTASPIVFTSIYGGEDYDARLEKAGWNTAAYDDAAWKPAVMVTAPKGILQAEEDYPVAVNDILPVKKIYTPKDSVYMYDFGQNLSGIVELKVQGKKGQVIKLSPAELINDKRMANQNATGRPYYFSYTLKGDGVETWRPRFSYYGFRYVQVEGAVPDTAKNTGDFAKIISLQSLHTGNSAPAAGNFSCSNELFNRINQLIKWAVKSNLQSVVTDCPHREKLGWLEQYYLMGGSIQSGFDIYHLYKKVVNDMMDAQTAEGLIPSIVPEYAFFDDNGFGFRDSPEWGSAAVIVPWLLYKWYGDTTVIREAYPMMTKYVGYLQKKANHNILNYGLGDWFDYGPSRPGVAQLTPKALTATAVYYYDVSLLSFMATMLNKKEEAIKYQQLSAAVKQSFTDSFFNAKTKLYATGSQTAMAMPLSLGLVDAKDKAAVVKNMVDSITASGKKLTAGDIGFHFLVEALHKGNASQLIYDMNYRDDVPGYGYQLKKGATALTESWPALEEVSNNHLMLGHIMQWFYEGLGGIDQTENGVAYNNIIIKPELVGDISFVNANRQTVYGNIVSEWKKLAGGLFTLKLQVPANTRATVYLPAKTKDVITENNKPVAGRTDMKLTGYENGRAKIELGSGFYMFTVQSK